MPWQPDNEQKHTDYGRGQNKADRALGKHSKTHDRVHRHHRRPMLRKIFCSHHAPRDEPFAEIVASTISLRMQSLSATSGLRNTIRLRRCIGWCRFKPRLKGTADVDCERERATKDKQRI